MISFPIEPFAGSVRRPFTNPGQGQEFERHAHAFVRRLYQLLHQHHLRIKAVCTSADTKSDVGEVRPASRQHEILENSGFAELLLEVSWIIDEIHYHLGLNRASRTLSALLALVTSSVLSHPTIVECRTAKLESLPESIARLIEVVESAPQPQLLLN
jgi:hypothetical protein